SSVASSLTSRSGRSGTDPPVHSNSQHHHNSRSIDHSTGVPAGLLRTSKSPDVNSLRRSRSRSSSFCASLTRTGIPGGDLEDLWPGPRICAAIALHGDVAAEFGSSASLSEVRDSISIGAYPNAEVPMNSPNPQYIPNLEQLNQWTPQPVDITQAISPEMDVENHANQVSSTAASLLTQLSGQLQQLTTSNTASLQKQPRPISGNSVHVPNELAEFDLPAPPSPDMLDVR
ncbi:hypothetical protein ACTXT7_016601, partial [Hymenolepis weldensis]